MALRQTAEAIRARDLQAFKRCAGDARQDEGLLWSPRNSERPGRVSREVAEALAAEIEKMMATVALPEAEKENV